MDIREWVKMHPSSIVFGTVPLSTIVEKYIVEYGAVEISDSEIPNLWMHKFNAVNLPINETLKISEEMLHIKGIRIPITNRSKHLTLKDYVPRCTGDGDYIYLAYEDQVGYHYSNTNKLFLEVALAHGIDEKHVNQETEEYASYLFYLQCYLEHLSSEENGGPYGDI